MWRDGVNQNSLKMSNLKPLNVYCTFGTFIANTCRNMCQGASS